MLLDAGCGKSPKTSPTLAVGQQACEALSALLEDSLQVSAYEERVDESAPGNRVLHPVAYDDPVFCLSERV
jgi:hypothetical protein